MANWDKLNAEFDALIDNMTADDWRAWNENRAKKRTSRKDDMQNKAKLRFESLWDESCLNVELKQVKPIIIGKNLIQIEAVHGVTYAEDCSYALAA